MMRLVAKLTAGCLTLAYAGCAEARSYPINAFDGAWHLIFETRSGPCDPSYNFDVNISNGALIQTLSGFGGAYREPAQCALP